MRSAVEYGFHSQQWRARLPNAWHKERLTGGATKWTKPQLRSRQQQPLRPHATYLIEVAIGPIDTNVVAFLLIRKHESTEVDIKSPPTVAYSTGAHPQKY